MGTTAKDVLYTAVGVAVLATQRLQVQRRELQNQLEPTVREAASVTADKVQAQGKELQKQLEPTVRQVAVRLKDAAGVIDARVDPVLDRIEQRMPPTGRDLVRQARGVAKEARDTVLERVQATDR